MVINSHSIAVLPKAASGWQCQAAALSVSRHALISEV